MPKPKIITELEAIQKVQESEGIQLKEGAAEFDGEVVLQLNGNGYHYPISEWVKAIKIQEDFFQNGLMGYLDMDDSWNLIRNGIILGQELLFFNFSTLGSRKAGLNKEWSVDFSKNPLHVYKVTNLQERQANGQVSLSGLTYRLHFCSPELLVNQRVRVSRTLQGTIGDMITSIVKEDLKSSKKLYIEQTDDLKQVIIPNVSPILAIRTHLTPKAQKMVPTEQVGPAGKYGAEPTLPSIFKGRYSDFLFWETTRGYNFQPCIKPSEISNLVISLGQLSGQRLPYASETLIARTHKYTKTLDTLDSISEGAWGSKQISHNAHTKSYSVHQSNYLRSLWKYKYSHVSETPVFETEKFSRNRDDEDRMTSDWPDSRLMLSSFGGKRNTSINKSNREVQMPWKHTPVETSMQRSMQLYHALRYNNLVVQINGISKLETGQLLQIDLPNIGEGSGYGMKNPQAQWENRYNNLWIITGINHLIFSDGTTNHYTCELFLSNTMGLTEKELPRYDKLGHSKSAGFEAIYT